MIEHTPTGKVQGLAVAIESTPGAVTHVTYDGERLPIERYNLDAFGDLLAALEAIVHPNNERTIEFDSDREYYVADLEGGELEAARAAITKARQ